MASNSRFVFNSKEYVKFYLNLTKTRNKREETIKCERNSSFFKSCHFLEEL